MPRGHSMLFGIVGLKDEWLIVIKLEPLGHISATMSNSYSKRRTGKVKNANCLTKNLLEMESLPQIKNLLEMSEISSAAKLGGGVKDEANDERKKTYCRGHRGKVSASAEEREDGYFKRVCGADRIRKELRGAGVAQSRAGSNGESRAASAGRGRQAAATTRATAG